MELPYRGSGKIYYNDKEYQCDLYYKEKSEGVILKINIKNNKALGNNPEVPLKIPYLGGELTSGFRFGLLQLSRIKTQYSVPNRTSIYTYNAEYIFCGIGEHELKGPTFHKAEYTLSNIIKWGGESVYTIGEQNELIQKSDKASRVIYKGLNFSISYFVAGSFLPPIINQDLLIEHIKLEQHGIIAIEFEKEVEFNCLHEIFEKLKRLIEIALIGRVNVENIDVYSSNYSEQFGKTIVEQPIKVYGKGIQESEIKTISQRKSWSWISLSELVKQNSFEYYFENHERLAPIIELFLEPFYVEKISATRMFLNLTQALETYHSRFVTNDLNKFKDRVKNFVKGMPENNAEEIRKFLMANSKKFITLESRIADLLYANRKIYFDTGEIKCTDFPSVIAHTRNYYVHYDESIKQKYRVLSEEELQLYIRALFQILEYHILLELGFSNDHCELSKKLQDRWGKISDDLAILRESKLQNLV